MKKWKKAEKANKKCSFMSCFKIFSFIYYMEIEKIFFVYNFTLNHHSLTTINAHPLTRSAKHTNKHANEWKTTSDAIKTFVLFLKTIKNKIIFRNTSSELNLISWFLFNHFKFLLLKFKLYTNHFLPCHLSSSHSSQF